MLHGGERELTIHPHTQEDGGDGPAGEAAALDRLLQPTALQCLSALATGGGAVEEAMLVLALLPAAPGCVHCCQLTPAESLVGSGLCRSCCSELKAPCNALSLLSQHFP